MPTEKKYEGDCLCHSIKIVLHGSPKKVFICHCTDCQRSAGGGFQSSLFCDTEKVKVHDPDNKLKKYVVSGETLGSGFDKYKFFCGDCGTPLFNQSMKYEGKNIVVKGAILDKLQDGNGSLLEIFPVEAECFVKDRASFLAPLEGVKQFEKGPQ